MAEFKILQEQEKIKNSRNKSILVSASAGSGKTKVMVERICSHLFSDEKNFNANLKELLILTFTDAAAEELRQRLELTISSTPKENANQICDDIKLADISTFHGFCQKLLKTYFYKLNINPLFEIIDEAESVVLLNKSVELAINQMQHNNLEQLLILERDLCSEKSHDNIIKTIKTLHEFLTSITNQEDWLNCKMSELYSTQFLDNIKKYLYSIIKKSFAVQLKALKKAQCDAQMIKNRKLADHLNDFIIDCKEICSCNYFDELYLELFKDKFKAGVYRKNNIYISIQEECIAIRDKYKKIKKYFQTNYFFGDLNTINHFMNRGEKVCDALKELLLYTQQIYSNKKAELNKLDFSDLERKMIELLQINEINEEIKNKYKFIYIDEYQDTNPIQENIILQIQKKNNVFMVGDVKQAIYGFRQSTSKFFLDKMNSSENNKHLQVLRLKSNFRSDKQILDFVNLVFSKIMTKKNCGIDYRGTDKLKFEGTNVPPQNPQVYLNICVNQKQNLMQKNIEGIYSVKQDYENTEIVSERNLECEMIAQKILQLKSENIFDSKINAFRKIEFSDIAILARTRTHIDQLNKTLAMAQIPYISTSQNKLLEDADIVSIIDFLNCLQNMNNDVYLCSCMMSRFGGFSCDEMTKICQLDNCGSLYKKINKYFETIQDEISEKIKLFIKFCSKTQSIIFINNVYTALEFAFNSINYEEHICKKSNGIAKLQKVKCFLSIIEANQDKSLSEILSYFEGLKVSSKSVSFVEGGDNCVTISTMHASKGLEYPVVFLYDLAQDFKTQFNDSIELNASLGIAFNINDQKEEGMCAIQKKYLQLINKTENVAERIRLLYVATTRAQNMLFLCGTMNNIETEIDKIKNSTTEDQSSYLNLILSALGARTIKLLKNQKSFKIKNGDGFINIGFYSDEETNDIFKIEDKITIADNQKINIGIIKDYLNFKYPYDSSTKILLKNTVSALALPTDEYTAYNYSPKKFDRKENSSKFAVDEVGTIYHKVFELIPFEKIKTIEQLKDKITQLTNQNFFTNNEDEVLDIQLIYNNITLLNNIAGNNPCLKEQQFIMNVDLSEFNGSNIKDNILVQGKIDLIILGEKPILIDYKLSSLESEQLKKKYDIQLKLYKLAIEKTLKTKVDKVFILHINKNELIEMPK